MTEVKTAEGLSMEDKHALDIIKLKKALSQTNAEKAMAQADAIEFAYKNIILQLSIKYSLTENDIIEENGAIVRNVPKQEGEV